MKKSLYGVIFLSFLFSLLLSLHAMDSEKINPNIYVGKNEPNNVYHIKTPPLLMEKKFVSCGCYALTTVYRLTHLLYGNNIFYSHEEIYKYLHSDYDEKFIFSAFDAIYKHSYNKSNPSKNEMSEIIRAGLWAHHIQIGLDAILPKKMFHNILIIDVEGKQLMDVEDKLLKPIRVSTVNLYLGYKKEPYNFDYSVQSKIIHSMIEKINNGVEKYALVIIQDSLPTADHWIIFLIRKNEQKKIEYIIFDGTNDGMERNYCCLAATCDFTKKQLASAAMISATRWLIETSGKEIELHSNQCNIDFLSIADK